MPYLSAPTFLLVLLAAAGVGLVPSRLRPGVLLLASLAFYAASDPAHLAILLAICMGVHAVGLRMAEQTGRGRILALAVAALFALLAFFKASQGGLLSGLSGGLRLAMPLGLSYFVFKLVSYLVDVYWGRRPPEKSLGRLALYALFFPQIVSGPIQRAGHFLDQLDRVAVDLRAVDRGLRLIAFGIFQKLVADQFVPLVARVHASPREFSSLELLLGAYAFAFELYLDFAGLSDMAIGLGALFGLETPHNFDRPFFSPSIQDFWRRWHMTLSSWLSDYLFTPLWSSLRDTGNFGLVVAIMANMMAIGLWHGPKWTFLVFGLLNGVHMTVSVLTKKSRDAFFKKRPWLEGARQVTSRLLTFHLIVAYFVLVRADSFTSAVDFLTVLGRGLFESGRVLEWTHLGVSATQALGLFTGVAAAESIHWLRRREPASHLLAAPLWLSTAVTAAVVVYVIFCREASVQEFFYARF